jgi:hypothetical protein
MHSLQRLTARALIPAIVVGLAIAQGVGAHPAGATTTAGTDIGSATELTGAATGSLANHLSDDWWVVYPMLAGDTVQIRVANTGGGSSGCTSLVAYFRDTNATQVRSTVLTPNTSYNSPFSATSSDRYFVEVQTASSCDPLSLHPIHYSLTLQSGGGGLAPSPVASSATAKSTIVAAWPPLQGATSYRGTIANNLADEWYVLYRSTQGVGTIRVENTTVDGSTPCNGTTVYLRDTDGTMLSAAVLTRNTAYTFTINGAWRYYLELTDQGCANGGEKYRIEPEGTTAWNHPAKLPSQALPVGHTLGTAGGPLAGAIVYNASLGTANVQDWSYFKPKGTVPVTVSVQNGTLNTGTCKSVVVYLTDSHGNQVSAAVLSDNTGHEFVQSTSARFYLHVNDQGCDPTTSVLPKFTVTITPANGV